MNAAGTSSGHRRIIGESDNTTPAWPKDIPIPETFRCPLTKSLMVDPVIDKEGNTYERDAIKIYLTATQGISPTNKQLKDTDLIENRGLKIAIEAALQTALEQKKKMPPPVSTDNCSNKNYNNVAPMAVPLSPPPLGMMPPMPTGMVPPGISPPRRSSVPVLKCISQTSGAVHSNGSGKSSAPLPSPSRRIDTSSHNLSSKSSKSQISDGTMVDANNNDEEHKPKRRLRNESLNIAKGLKGNVLTSLKSGIANVLHSGKREKKMEEMNREEKEKPKFIVVTHEEIKFEKDQCDYGRPIRRSSVPRSSSAEYLSSSSHHSRSSVVSVEELQKSVEERPEIVMSEHQDIKFATLPDFDCKSKSKLPRFIPPRSSSLNDADFSNLEPNLAVKKKDKQKQSRRSSAPQIDVSDRSSSSRLSTRQAFNTEDLKNLAQYRSSSMNDADFSNLEPNLAVRKDKQGRRSSAPHVDVSDRSSSSRLSTRQAFNTEDLKNLAQHRSSSMNDADFSNLEQNLAVKKDKQGRRSSAPHVDVSDRSSSSRLSTRQAFNAEDLKNLAQHRSSSMNDADFSNSDSNLAVRKGKQERRKAQKTEKIAVLSNGKGAVRQRGVEKRSELAMSEHQDIKFASSSDYKSKSKSQRISTRRFSSMNDADFSNSDSNLAVEKDKRGMRNSMPVNLSWGDLSGEIERAQMLSLTVSKVDAKHVQSKLREYSLEDVDNDQSSSNDDDERERRKSRRDKAERKSSDKKLSDKSSERRKSSDKSSEQMSRKKKSSKSAEEVM